MKEVAVKAVDLNKIYVMGRVEVPALRGVSLEIMRGELVGIMGPSGSGKSTLLHLLALLDTPTSGRVYIEGAEASSLSEELKSRFRLEKLGYVFQEFNLMPELTALENTFLPAMMLGKSMAECAELGAKILEKVALGKRLHHLPSELSGGEQQRVSIARALINSPSILFADEPTANLDTKTAQGIMNLFRTLRDDFGQTIVVVTHEPEYAKILDRAIYLRDGEISRMEELPMSTCAHCGCRIFKEGAVARIVGGKELLFCSQSCARSYTEQRQS